MKPEELMIGDYIMFNKNTYIIEEISKKGWAHLIDNDGSECHVELSSDYILDAITPIPLTEEILEKNGFVKDKTQYGEDFYAFWSEDSEYCIYLYLYGVYFFLFDNINMQIKYVHELQHALRLCGINKEIEI